MCIGRFDCHFVIATPFPFFEKHGGNVAQADPNEYRTSANPYPLFTARIAVRAVPNECHCKGGNIDSTAAVAEERRSQNRFGFRPLTVFVDISVPLSLLTTGSAA